MNRRQFRIGPGAASMLLISVILSMCVLGVLSLLNARNDHQLSRRSVQVACETAQLNADAQASLALLDAALLASSGSYDTLSLPEGMVLEDDVISWEEVTPDGRTLYCAVRVPGEGSQRYEWVCHRMSTQTEDLGDDEEWN